MSRTTAVALTVEDRIQQIGSLVNQGLSFLRQAGEIVVDLMMNDGLSARDISAQSEFLTVRDVNDLKRVGEGTLNPSLMVLTAPATKYLESAPIDIQSDVINNGVEVLVAEGDRLVKKRLGVNELSHRYCKQVFNNGRINSVAQQRRIISNGAGSVRERRPAYGVADGFLVVNRPCSISKAELKALLRSM